MSGVLSSRLLGEVHSLGVWNIRSWEPGGREEGAMHRRWGQRLLLVPEARTVLLSTPAPKPLPALSLIFSPLGQLQKQATRRLGSL